MAYALNTVQGNNYVPILTLLLMKFVPTLPNKAVYVHATGRDVRQGNNVPMLIQRVVNSVLKLQGRVVRVLDMDQLNARVHLRGV